MINTKEFQKQKENTTLFGKKPDNESKLTHNSCGGCNACHEMTRNHALTGNMFRQRADGAGQELNLQRPCANTFFQRNLGNNYLQSVTMKGKTEGQSNIQNSVPKIQRKCSCGGSCPSCAEKEEDLGKIQTKLVIGPANDVYEQEADRLVDQVIQMPDSSVRNENERVGMGMTIQRISASESHTPNFAPDIQLNQSGGRPLSVSTRQFMEPRFGVNFGQVQLHTDQNASQIASQIQARAFTYGHHIWLGRGESEQDKKLMAHELVHVSQQKSRLGDSMTHLKSNFSLKSISTNNEITPLIQKSCQDIPTHTDPDTYCQTREEAEQRVTTANPSNCFVYRDGPSGFQWRPIPGFGCAHYVAHQLGITEGPAYANCLDGFSVTIEQITTDKTARPLSNARVNDIWTDTGEIHSAVVREVGTGNTAGQVRIQACGLSGNIYTHWTSSGAVHQ